MTLIKHRNQLLPFSNALENLLGRDLSELMDLGQGHTAVPAVNIKETAEDFRVEVAAPGMKKEDFTVTVENNTLTISSELKSENTETNDSYSRREFNFQSFRRSFALPNTVNGEAITAAYQDGLLLLTIPKREEAKEKPARQIEIA